MMRTHSIRWRLTLSYAVIACLAALALGAVLLSILRGYYAGKERDYLVNNAESLQTLLSSTIAENVPIDTLRPQLENLAFIAKVRIRVLDNQNQELIDTGTPANPYVISFFYTASDQTPDDLHIQSITLNPLNATTLVSGNVPIVGSTAKVWQVGIPADAPVLAYDLPFFDPAIIQSALGGSSGGAMVTIRGSDPARFAEGDVTVNAVSALPLSSTFYGFSLGTPNSAELVSQGATRRSDQQIKSVLFDADHNRLGLVILSDGPAYGSEIVNSVARGWLFAGGIAVLLAAVVGWIVSCQISKPLLALTEVTSRMTVGELSARADIERQDELGVLALSFNAMADRIQEIVTTLQRFVADAAHEIHTPLTALRTNLEIACSEHPSLAIHRAHEQVIRLEKLTDGLLTLSRIEASSDPGTIELVDLKKVVCSASELYASRAEQSDLEFEMSLPEHVPPVRGRFDQLEGVLANLMDNAIKFTPAGGTVALGVHTFDHTLELTVQDTGIGIPADDLPLLFERFRRAHNASNHPGSGLGLAITKAIVKAHGGSIRAESSGRGTKITVTLPFAQVTKP